MREKRKEYTASDDEGKFLRSNKYINITFCLKSDRIVSHLSKKYLFIRFYSTFSKSTVKITTINQDKIQYILQSIFSDA